MENQTEALILDKDIKIQPLLPVKKTFTQKIKKLIKELTAVLFWLYLIFNVFIFDVDAYLLTKFGSKYIWIINYKFFVIIGIIAIIWIVSKNKDIIFTSLYILFYPFIFLIYVFYLIYKLGSWNFAIALINSILFYFKSIKYSFITLSIFLVSSVLIFSTNNKILLWGSIIGISIILVISFIRKFINIFKPSLIYQVYSYVVSKSLNYGKNNLFIDKEIKSKGITFLEMSEPQLQKYTQNLQTAVVANKICYFLASKLKNYQKSKIGIISGILSVLFLFLITVFSFGLISFAFEKIYPGFYQIISMNNSFFTFFYFSFNMMLNNHISGVIELSNYARSISMIEQTFSLLIISMFLSLFVAIKNERETNEIDEVIKKIKEQGDEMGNFIEAEYNLTIEEAINMLTNVKSAMLKIIMYLTKNIT